MYADLKFALRQLRKAPGFTLTVILTLALGVAANIAIFALVDSIILQPLPYPQQHRLMRIGYGGGESNTAFFPKGWLRALGEHSASFASISGFGPDTQSNLGEANAASRVFGAEVMANALNTLDVSPVLGRFFSSDYAIAGHDPVVVLSYGFWRDAFAADPGVVGRALRIDGVPRRVIGILPAGVRFPYADTQFLTPITFDPGDVRDPWRRFDLYSFGRLRDGVSPAQAQSDLRRMQKLLLPLFPWQMPDTWASNMTVVPLLESEVGSTRPRLLLLFSAVGLILLIACANVANLMLARASGREREIAIRGALGASASRLMRQLVVESLVLGAAAGVVGLAAAAIGLRLLVRQLPADTPRLNDVSLHWQVFVFAAAISLLTGFLFGLIPAIRMSSPNLRDSLHAASRSVAGRAGQFRLSMLLVMGQIALSVLVITAAGLMLHSLWTLSQVNPGFRTDRIVTAEVSLDSSACRQQGRCPAFFSTLLDRLRGVSSAESVALSDSLPLRAPQGGYVYDAEDHPRSPRQGALLATGRIVTPDYFSSLGMQLVRGRLLNEQDASGTTRAVVINQTMARRLWPHRDPLGMHLLRVTDEPQPAVWNQDKAVTVVGIVNNTHEGSLASDFGEQVYLPVTPALEQPTMYVLLRTRATTAAAAQQLRETVAGLDPYASVTGLRTLNEVVASSESSQRSLTLLLLAFGALAVIIGSIGVYSLIAYIVSWRMREFGIRLALGAQRWQIVQRVLRQSLLLALAGSAAGLVAAALTGQIMRSFLFEVQPLDPATYAAVAALMTLLALAAAWVPAQRAARVDPIKTLRAE